MGKGTEFTWGRSSFITTAKTESKQDEAVDNEIVMKPCAGLTYLSCKGKGASSGDRPLMNGATTRLCSEQSGVFDWT